MRPKMFLSHSSADKPFVRRFAASIKMYGIDVWIDEAEIKIGDSLIRKISEGLTSSSHMAAIISINSIGSEWVSRELEYAITSNILQKNSTVLPIKIDECEMPTFLVGRLYADFTGRAPFNLEVKKVARALGGESSSGWYGDETDDYDHARHDIALKLSDFEATIKRQIGDSAVVDFFPDGSGIGFVKVPIDAVSFKIYNDLTIPSSYEVIANALGLPSGTITEIKLFEDENLHRPEESLFDHRDYRDNLLVGILCSKKY